MAAPIPPQGTQQSYTERPARVYGEQYRVGSPLPVGVVAEHLPLYPAAAGPYAILTTGVEPVKDTDWILTNRFSGKAVDVISAEEFSERFGPGGGP